LTDSNHNHAPAPQYFDAPNPHGASGTHKIAFYEWGSPYAPAIFCAHGLTRNGRDFDYLARQLAAHYRVIAVDVAGRGNSSPLSNLRWYENSTYMQDILALAERMNLPKFDWIGTSMGGIIGMMIASLMPGKITRMVLNDIGALIPAEGLMRIGDYVGKRDSFPSLYEADSYLRKIMQPFGITQPEHWDHMLQHSLVHHEDGSITFSYDPAIGDAFRLAASEMEKIEDISLWMLWESITCPTLIIRGEKSDILSRETATRMCAEHKKATLVEFAGIGHAPTLMDDQQINAILQWLQANPLKCI
jgi:pimeloyl-ACP methyl ester carboxylesterase